MIKIRLNHKGQNMAEYAIIFGIVIAAAVGISALIKEGIQDRAVSEVRKIADDNPLGAAVVSPFDVVSDTDRVGKTVEDINVAAGGQVGEVRGTHGTADVVEDYSAGN